MSNDIPQSIPRSVIIRQGIWTMHGMGASFAAYGKAGQCAHRSVCFAFRSEP